MKTIIVVNINFFKTYCILTFFSSHCLHQFPIHNEKKFHRSVFIFCYLFYFQKTVNNGSFACQIAVFVVQQRQNEDSIAQIRPFEFSKNKSKQTVCDSCILVSMCMYIWSSSSVFTMSYLSYYAILLYHNKYILCCWWIPVSF